jgi:hypothetical protein
MSPRLLFLLNARNSPSRRRAGHPPRGLSDRDWMDAQAAAARMPGRSRVAKVLPRLGRADRARLAEPARVHTAVAAHASR